MTNMKRRRFLVAVPLIALIISGCGVKTSDSTPSPFSSDSESTTQAPSSGQSSSSSSRSSSSSSRSSSSSSRSSSSSSQSSSSQSSSKPTTVHATDFQIVPDSVTVRAGENYQFQVQMTPANATSPVSWEVSEYAGSISDTGLFTAAHIGSYVVTARIDSPKLQGSAATRYARVTIEKGDLNVWIDSDTNTAQIIGISAPIEEVHIPETFAGYPVTSIAEVLRGSSYNSDFTENYFTQVKKMYIPRSIEQIEENAFVFGPNIEFHYEGTRSEWLSINEGWCPDNVHCSDGILSDNLTGPDIPEGDTADVGMFNLWHSWDGKIYIQSIDITDDTEEIHIPATYNGFPINIENLYYPCDETPILHPSLKRIYINAFYGGFTYPLHASNIDSITFGYNYRGNKVVINRILNSYDDTDTNIKSVVLDQNNPYYVVENNMLCSADRKILVWGGTVSGNITLPTTIEIIGERAFMGSHITSINWTSVTEIQNFAFMLSSLTSIDLTGVQTLGDEAFGMCARLTSATNLPNLEVIPDYLFTGCSSLSSITLPNNVTSIGRGAFGETYSLREITLPDGLEEIDDNAFNNSGLLSISIPDSVTKIGDEVFSGCALETAHLPAGLKEIPRGMFQSCNGLIKVDVPSSVIKINDYAFAWDALLSIITLPNDLRFIGDFAFFCCYGLRNLNIPSSVVVVGNDAFCCVPLTSVELGPELEELGINSFDAMSNITVNPNNPFYVIEDGVLYNKQKTHLYCYDMHKTAETFKVPNTVSFINAGAFSAEIIEEYVTELNIQFNTDISEEIKTALYAAGWDDELWPGFEFTDPSGRVKLRVHEEIIKADVWGDNDYAIYGTEINIYVPDSYHGYILPPSFPTKSCVPQYISDYLAAEGISDITIPYIPNVDSSKILRCYPWSWEGTPFSFSLKNIILPTSIAAIEGFGQDYTMPEGITIFYEGSQTDWEKIVGHNVFETFNVKYYSQSSQSGCWRYVNGEPTLW